MSELTKREETRKRILDSALKLFQSKGFEATTMRDIASKADMAVGAAYYHFKSKEEIVFAYYTETQEDSDRHAEELCKKTKDPKARIAGLLRFKLEQLKPYRTFLSVLGQTAVSPENPLSPFSKETKDIRSRAIRLFELACNDGNLKVAAGLRADLPKLLWFYEMGIIFFWLQDESPKQKRTDDLIEETLGTMLRLLSLSSLPLMKPLVRKVSNIISIVEGV